MQSSALTAWVQLHRELNAVRHARDARAAELWRRRAFWSAVRGLRKRARRRQHVRATTALAKRHLARAELKKSWKQWQVGGWV